MQEKPRLQWRLLCWLYKGLRWGFVFGLLCYQGFSKIHNRPNLAQPSSECLAARVRAIKQHYSPSLFSSIMSANKEACLGKTLSIKQASPTYFHFDQGNEVSREQGRQSSTFSVGLLKFINKKKGERKKIMMVCNWKLNPSLVWSTRYTRQDSGASGSWHWELGSHYS